MSVVTLITNEQDKLSDKVMSMIYGIEYSYIVALSIFLIGWVVLWAAKKIIIGRLAALAEKTSSDLDDAFIGILQTINPAVLGAASAAFAIRFTEAPSVLVQAVSAAFLIAVVYQVSVGVAHAVDVAVQKRQGKRVEVGQKAAVTFLSTTVKWIIWALGGLMVLSNLGVNVTSLVAGLGIGGLAVALALQNVLSDLFASFSIYFDKPFEVGDFIVVGSHTGTVEKIGIKTTRLRALQGEEIVIANAELTAARVQNFKKLKKRRVVIRPGVLYETPSAALKEIPKLLEGAVSGVEQAQFDRAHLAEYGDSAIVFELVYYALTSEYAEYMDLNQTVLFNIKEAFDGKGIEFAYPTQTLYVKRDS